MKMSWASHTLHNQSLQLTCQKLKILGLSKLNCTLQFVIARSCSLLVLQSLNSRKMKACTTHFGACASAPCFAPRTLPSIGSCPHRFIGSCPIWKRRSISLAATDDDKPGGGGADAIVVFFEQLLEPLYVRCFVPVSIYFTLQCWIGERDALMKLVKVRTSQLCPLSQ